MSCLVGISGKPAHFLQGNGGRVDGGGGEGGGSGRRGGRGNCSQEVNMREGKRFKKRVHTTLAEDSSSILIALVITLSLPCS